jgi:hypothetical protein
MTNRAFFLFLATGSWILCAVVTTYAFLASPIPRGTFLDARLLTALIFFTVAGGLFCLMLAFSNRQIRLETSRHFSFIRFVCPCCGAQLNYSRFPASRKEISCSECAEIIVRFLDGLRRLPRTNHHT